MTAPFPLLKPTTADWQPYAKAVIARLRNALRVQITPDVPVDLGSNFDGSFDAPKPAPALSMAAQLDAILAPDPSPAEAPALPSLDVDQLMLAVQLAGVFGTADGLQKVLQPGVTTLIRGFPMRSLDIAEKVLREGFLEAGWTVQTDARYARPSHDILLCLVPNVQDQAVSKYALSKFEENFAAVMSLPHPVLMLVPAATDIPASISACRPEVLEVPRMDRDRLIVILREVVADWPEDDDALCGALPPDQLIAGLSGPVLRSALRLPEAAQVVERLAALVKTPKLGPNLDDIVGDGAALTAAKAMISDLQLWQAGGLDWQEMRRSMLIYGSPGTGKTWLAQAMGNTPGVGFVSASFPQWQSAGHLGDMLAAMRRSFDEAVQRRPSILFVDEIDAIGSRISGDRHGENYRHYVINGFLQQIDMLMAKEGVLLIGACNFVDRLDPAITRLGRFDLTIEMPQPTAAGLHAILARHFPAGFDDSALRDLAVRAVGASAADADGAARAAKGMARTDKRQVVLSDIETSLGLSATRVESDWRTAVHEIGHVLICGILGLGQIERVALTRDGGETIRRSRGLESTQQGIADEICYVMGGRAAEVLVFGAASGGAGGPDGSDLAKATRLALWYDTKFGLGDFGPLWFDAPDASFLHDPKIQSRVRQRIEAAQQRAITLLAQHRTLLDDMAKRLLRQREMSRREVAGWLVQITEPAMPG